MASKTAPALLLSLVALLLASEAFGTSAASLDSVASDTGFSLAPVIRTEATRAGVALVLGILAPLGLWPVTQFLTGKWRPTAWLFWGAATFGALTAWVTLAWGQIPSVSALMGPFLLGAVGIVIGAAVTVSWKRLAVAVAGVAVCGAAGVAAAAALFWASLAPEPLDFQLVSFNDAEKRSLVTRLREERPAPDEPRVLRLTETDLSGLLNSALLRLGSQHKARIELQPEESTLELSLAGPSSWERRWLNVRAVGDLQVADGRLNARLSQLSIGGWTVPWPLSSLPVGLLQSAAKDEPKVRTVLDLVTDTQIEKGQFSAVFDAGKVGQDILPSLVEQVWHRPQVAAETRAYIEPLLAKAAELEKGDDLFTNLMQEAFRLAGERTQAGGEPQLENRAAILALTILLGHEGVEQFVGNVLEPADRKQLPRLMGRATLRGRSDWPRHFLVSAAMKLVSNDATGDSVGVFKEHIDSQAGGSGFSFADLLANMAGIRFAELATGSERGAAAVQSALGSTFDVENVFPFAADLPEGLSAEEVERDYGGVQGAGYQRVLREMQYRLEELPRFGE